VERTHERVTIARHGQSVAVLISPVELEALDTTIEALSDPDTRTRIAEAEDAIESGDTADADTIRSVIEARAGT
jgi:PHD/YefM family antitoxin component YafN of YafNO toxin-antitoxin module